MTEVIKIICEKIHKHIERLAAEGRSGGGAGGDSVARRGVQIMEICGTHTMAIARSGLRDLLPESLRLISGPGCPVCVTDQSYIDSAIALARGTCFGSTGIPACGVISTGTGSKPVLPKPPIIATYGDMLRVPGRGGSLAEARSAGASVEVVASADQAVELACRNPDRHVVFLAVGFETTAPGTALAILRARRDGVGNFSVMTAHKLVLPVMDALLAQDDVRVDGFLCPGHVSVIIGWGVYEPIASNYGRPCVVAGFDPPQILVGIEEILRQIVAGSPAACSIYPAVTREGNTAAAAMLEQVFAPADVPWRAMGVIPGSGLVLRDEFAEFDATKRFDLPESESYELPGCRCGDVLAGRCGPRDCDLFATDCTPRDPVGPCMVSSEGACAAAFKYGRRS